MLIPLAALFLKSAGWAGMASGGGVHAARAGRLPPELRRRAGRGRDQRRVRPDRRLGAGALPFPGKRLVDALVDLPFALPTAVAGIALDRALRRERLDRRAARQLGIKVAFTPLGIVVALTFIGLPFVVRTVQPVLAGPRRGGRGGGGEPGRRPLQTFLRVILPALLPALLTGFALAFARGVGEYGSVIFISGNMPMVSEIAPLLIIIKLEQYDYAGRHGDRHRHAGRLVLHAARHQRAAALEQAAQRLRREERRS